jgi:hypothetical protein
MNRLGITGIIRKIVKLNAFSQKIRQLNVKFEKIVEIEKESNTKFRCCDYVFCSMNFKIEIFQNSIFIPQRHKEHKGDNFLTT